MLIKRYATIEELVLNHGQGAFMAEEDERNAIREVETMEEVFSDGLTSGDVGGMIPA